MPKALSTCVHCGAGFVHFPSAKRLCCSKVCAGQHQAQVRREKGLPRAQQPKARTGETLECLICGTPFYARAYEVKKGRKYCSPGCRSAADRRPRTEKPCAYCGKIMSLKPSAITYGRRYCSMRCRNLGELETSTLLDRSFNGMPVKRDADGYCWLWLPERSGLRYGGWYQEHRYVVEEDMGRRLPADSHIHHVNGIKDDNRRENLLVMAHGDHARLSVQQWQEHLQRELAELAEYRKRYGPLVTDA